MSDDTITVQRRELFDYAYRATRLTGADHGVALLVAGEVAGASPVEIHLERLLTALERGDTPAFELRATVHRPRPVSGIVLPAVLWHALTERARPYLVPEALIDGSPGRSPVR